jgi:hypothetical protein
LARAKAARNLSLLRAKSERSQRRQKSRPFDGHVAD